MIETKTFREILGFSKKHLHRRGGEDAEEFIFHKIGRCRFYERSSRLRRVKGSRSDERFSFGGARMRGQIFIFYTNSFIAFSRKSF